MPESQESRVLLDQWRAGDEQAARALFDRYVERLLALARRRISQRLASRVDAEDIVQSVFRTFFVHAREGRFQVAQQDDLAKLLVRITVHKTLRQVEFHKAAKRDPGLEVAQDTADSHARLLEVLDREPAAEDVVAFVDELEHFLAQLRPTNARSWSCACKGTAPRRSLRRPAPTTARSAGSSSTYAAWPNKRN